MHIDPIGTILLPLMAAFSGLPIIGWAKPVPVNISRLRRARRDFMIVAAAGPASNLLQAIAGRCCGACAVVGPGHVPPGHASVLMSVLFQFVQINVLLALFNLIPVPPLDGGNVLAGLLPESAAHAFDSIRQFGFIILYALMLTGMLARSSSRRRDSS